MRSRTVSGLVLSGCRGSAPRPGQKRTRCARMCDLVRQEPTTSFLVLCARSRRVLPAHRRCRRALVTELAFVLSVFPPEDMRPRQPRDTRAGLQRANPEVPVFEVERFIVASKLSDKGSPNEARLHDCVAGEELIPVERDSRTNHAAALMLTHYRHVRRQYIHAGRDLQPRLRALDEPRIEPVIGVEIDHPVGSR